MDPKLISTSKFLSLILRHKPEEIGLVLDAQGWADIDELIHLANLRGKSLTRSGVEELVATNEKRRFAISADGARIRASQGHSVSVDLGLQPQTPPERLFHGTATRHLPSIRRHGLHSGSRSHVHLSKDEATATNVGARHGKPAVLTVQSGAMCRDGFLLFLSENGVWLTERVPTRYIEFPA